MAVSSSPRRARVSLLCAMVGLGCSPTDDYFIAQAVTTPAPSTTATGTSSVTPPPPVMPSAVCGNDVAEASEGCDGPDLRGGSCAGLGLDTGMLRCTAECRFDISGCSARAPVCGDGLAEASEGCDGADLRGQSCELLGLDGGELSCTAACLFDTSHCSVRAPACGDGAAEAAEACDGFDLRGQTCPGLGLPAGTLLCSNDCSYVLTGCNAPVVACGDGVAQAAESCDGADLRDQNCEAVGLGAGTLACNDDCTFDTSGCGMGGSGCEDAGTGGAGDDCCEPAAEVCDGQSNDCDDLIDEGACPVGCSASSYEDHVYLLCIHEQASLQLDYAEARAECAAAGSMLGLGINLELARIESEQENDFLKDWIDSTADSEGMVWMGANDIARENAWVWGQGANAVPFFTGHARGGGEPVQDMFHDFPENRPNSANDTDEDCGGFDSDVDWRWNDRLCTQARLGFVCEQASPPGTLDRR